jgi:hypothetical protein
MLLMCVEFVFLCLICIFKVKFTVKEVLRDGVVRDQGVAGGGGGWAQFDLMLGDGSQKAQPIRSQLVCFNNSL